MGNLIRKWPIIEISILVGIYLIWVYVIWPKGINPYEACYDERDIAAAAVKDALNAAITGASIVLAAVGAILGLSPKKGERDREHLVNAAFLCVVSILLGAWGFSLLPARVNVYNVAKDFWPVAIGALQFAALILGVVRLLIFCYRSV